MNRIQHLMKNIVIVQFLLLTAMANLPLYSQENPNTKSVKDTWEQYEQARKQRVKEIAEKNNWEQRKQTTKKFIRQEIEHGTSLENIDKKLEQKRQETPENKAWRQAIEAQQQFAIDALIKNDCRRGRGYRKDTPHCRSMEEQYEKMDREIIELLRDIGNTPEAIAQETVREILYREEIIKRKSKEKQELLDSLIQ